MSRTTLIIKNDFKRRLRAPLATVVFMVIPFAMTALIGMIFDPGSGTATKLPPIKVLLVDHDQNLASKFLIGAFDQKRLKEMFQATTVSEAEGEKLMKKGKASAMIIIPERFSEDLADQKTSRLAVVKNPAEEFLPEVVEEFANTMAVGLSGLAQVFADELKIIKLVGNSSLETFSFAELAPHLEMSRIKIMAAKKYLSPLLVGLKTSTIAKSPKATGATAQPQGFNIFAYILPGMLIMFMLFIIEAFMREIQNERADGKIRRMMFSPLTTRELVSARIVGGWLLGMLICGLAMVMGALIFAIDWGNYLWLFLLVAVTCFWCAAFFGMLNAFFKNKNQAGAFASPIILVSAAFGGSMLPLEQIPAGMRWLAKFTVNNWFITGCRQVVAHEIPLASLLVLLATALLFAVVAMIALQRRLTVDASPDIARKRKTIMKKIWHIASVDLKLTVRDRAFFFWFLVFPMFFILLFGNLYKSNPADKKAALLIVNQDKGKWGSYFIEKLKSPGIELDVQASPPEKTIRMLVIAPDFSEKLAAKIPQELELKKDPQANMEAGAVAETKIVQAITRLLSELIIYGDRDIKDFFSAHAPFNELVKVVTRLPEGTITKVPSGFDHVIPGTMVQFIMMMVLIYGGVTVMEDRKKRVMERILFSATSFGELFGGKLLGRVLMGLLQAAILLVTGMLFFHLNLGNVPLAGAIVLVFTLAMACLSIFVGSVLHKEELIVGVSVLASNMFAALGGCWWPAEIVPPAFRALGMVSPAYWAMDAFHQVIFFGKGFTAILPNLLILLAFTAVFMALALRFFKVRD